MSSDRVLHHLQMMQNRQETVHSIRDSRCSAGNLHWKMAIIPLLFITLLPAQGPAEVLKSEISTYPSFLGSGFEQTLTERSNRWILTGAGLSVLLLNRFDDPVQEYSEEHGLMSSELSHLLDSYGGGAAYPATLIGVGAVSWVNGEGWETGLRKLKYVITAFAVTAVATDALKRGVGRKRPEGPSTRAFPSGHTSGSFVVAATLDELYGWTVGTPAYLVATLVGAQRIHDNRHWLTDVIAGAALGTVIGRGFGVAFREGKNAPAASVESGGQEMYLVKVVFPLN